MLAWSALGAALGIDYAQHRRGAPTICSTGRIVPEPLLYGALGVGFTMLLLHLRNGYLRDRAFRIDLTRLTD